MSPPYVTGVTFNNSQIVLTVQVDNFQPGESLEISGQATQNGGGYAAFYGTKSVPERNPDGHGIHLCDVTATSHAQSCIRERPQN